MVGAYPENPDFPIGLSATVYGYISRSLIMSYLSYVFYRSKLLVNYIVILFDKPFLNIMIMFIYYLCINPFPLVDRHEIATYGGAFLLVDRENMITFRDFELFFCYYYLFLSYIFVYQLDWVYIVIFYLYNSSH